MHVKKGPLSKDAEESKQVDQEAPLDAPRNIQLVNSAEPEQQAQNPEEGALRSDPRLIQEEEKQRSRSLSAYEWSHPSEQSSMNSEQPDADVNGEDSSIDKLI